MNYDWEMISRRSMLKQALAAAAALGLGGAVRTAAGETPSGLGEIGIILNTVGKEVKTDYEKTFRRLAEMGYKFIESGRHYGDSAESFLKLLDSLGMKVIASGAAMSALKKEPTKAIENAQSLKAPFLVCYWPWLIGTEKLRREDVLRTAEELNKIGEQCKAAGLRFAMHNHDKEFRKLDGGETIYDLLLENTRPELVTMELDLYWIVKAGADPLDYFARHPGRFELLHLKDMDKTPEKGMAAVGEGVIDFPKIFAQAKRAGVKRLIVEHDRPADGMACAQSGIRYLQRLNL